LLGQNGKTQIHKQNLDTIEEVKRFYGPKAGEKLAEMEMMEDLIGEMQRLAQKMPIIDTKSPLYSSLFSEETFTERLPKSLERTMGKIMLLMGQYEQGKLARKSWAERMNGRNMRHFFDEDFYEASQAEIFEIAEINVKNGI
jgi:hypothetical protein